MAALEVEILAEAEKRWTKKEISEARTYHTLTESLAGLIEPEAWREYFAGSGTCANMDGWKCLESLRQAKRITDWLTA